MTEATTCCGHMSDCAVHNGPAEVPGPCSCGADAPPCAGELPATVTEAEARELITDANKMARAAHWRAVAAAWLEALCATDGYRMHRTLADTIVKKMAKVNYEAEQATQKADALLHELEEDRAKAERLMSGLHDRQNEVANTQRDAEERLASVQKYHAACDRMKARRYVRRVWDVLLGRSYA